MIINCKSCEKKFVVPDSAITSEGRVVQCGSCGNKWKQFPFKREINNEIIKLGTKKIERKPQVRNQIKKKKSIKRKKKREIDLYSPEYLAKKHGIRLDTITNNLKSKSSANKKVSFGFYANLLILIIFLIFF